jgi:hypothetical protein
MAQAFFLDIRSPKTAAGPKPCCLPERLLVFRRLADMAVSFAGSP